MASKNDGLPVDRMGVPSSWTDHDRPMFEDFIGLVACALISIQIDM